MSEETSRIDDEITEQITKIAEASTKIDLDLVQYLYDDIDKFKAYARKNNISTVRLTLLILHGIERGLVAYGKLEWKMIKELIAISKTALSKLMKSSEKEK